MSWNTSIQINKLYQAYLSLSTTALTNPMIANLNMANYNINNANTINAVSGSTLTLNADSSQGITVSTKLLIPNHPLVITNNTANDSLQVLDNTASDTSVFRVDNDGNVAIKSNTSTTLTNTFTVNGESSFTGNITCSGLTCGIGGFSGSLTAPTKSSGDNTTNVATTAFVQSAIPSGALNGKVSYTNFQLDGTGTPLTIPANQLGNAFIFCNTPNSSFHTLNLPNMTALTAQFGANAVVNFFVGQLNVSVFNPIYPNTAFGVDIVSPTGNEYWANNYNTQAPTSPLTVSSWSNYNLGLSVHFPAIYKVQITIQLGKAYYYYDYAGFAFP
jgi:hypothetical protein